MSKQIKRRDFVSGIAIGAGGLLLAGCADDLPSNLTNEVPSVSLPPLPGSYYPPTLTGMRGSTKDPTKWLTLSVGGVKNPLTINF